MLMIIASHIPYTMDGTVASKLLHILLFDYWGAFGTALFFLLSGYGMFLSLHKTKNVNTSYVTNKLKKLFMPFLFTWMVYLVYFLLMDRSQLNQHLLMDFMTISLPYGIDIWFFKVIIGLYVAIILLFKLPISDILRVIVMFIVVTIDKMKQPTIIKIDRELFLTSSFLDAKSIPKGKQRTLLYHQGSNDSPRMII